MIRPLASVLRFVLHALWKPVPLPLVLWAARLRTARGPVVSPNGELARILRLKDIRSVGQVRVDEWDIRLVCVDSYIVKNLYFFGARGYEYGVVNLWRRICAETDCAVEIGANIGLFCLAGAKRNPTIRYRAYEPLPVAARILRENLALNDLTSTVDVVEAAVVDDNAHQTVCLNIPQEGFENVPTGSFVAGLTNKLKTTASTLHVPAVDMLEAISGAGAIKIDAEGIEPNLLSRGLQTILKTQPEIIVEILRWDSAFCQVVKTLCTHGGYSLHVILDQGLRQIDHTNPTRVNEALAISRDFLLSAKERQNSPRKHSAH
jgi:FkbM family methyltransferase